MLLAVVCVCVCGVFMGDWRSQNFIFPVLAVMLHLCSFVVILIELKMALVFMFYVVFNQSDS